jgi:hypothetical protein
VLHRPDLLAALAADPDVEARIREVLRRQNLPMRENVVLNLNDGRYRAYQGGVPIGDFGSAKAA